MLFITRIGTITEISLVKPTEIKPCIRKVLSKVGTASAVFTITMYEKDYSFSFFSLSRVSVVLKLYVFIGRFLHSH